MSRIGTPLLFILSGPAGSGKTTLCYRLLKEFPRLQRAVTATTRIPRPEEKDGIDYHFLSQPEFDRKMDASEMLESAMVHGRSYGTPATEVVQHFENGEDVLLSIDVQGMRQIREKASHTDWLRGRVVTIFINPPSLDELRERLRRRGTDGDEEIEKRIETARKEMTALDEFDYLLDTSSREEDFDRIRAIYLAEKMRSC